MPDATKRPLSEWRDTEWLQHLQRQAQRLTACPQSADDLAHTCLLAFHDHHRCYPWQHPEPAHALRWCCQKLRALACDAYRRAQRHPCLTLETLPESVACVDIAAQMQADIDGARFVASLPPRLRAAVELRLAGYSWDEAAQQLGVSASTLRGYLPELRAKFVDFFGYAPSKRASESLIRAEGKTVPQMIEEETQMKAMLGLVNGLVTTRNMLRAKSLVAMGRPKRGGLRWVRRVLTGSKGRWLMVATLFGFAMPWQRALYALILVVVALFQTTKVSLSLSG
jgi:DNA-directed RNA polymerase specialized sigma24 family protein